MAEFKDADKTMPIMLMLVNKCPDVTEQLKEIEQQSIGSVVAQWLHKQSEEYQNDYDVVMEALAFKQVFLLPGVAAFVCRPWCRTWTSAGF